MRLDTTTLTKLLELLRRLDRVQLFGLPLDVVRLKDEIKDRVTPKGVILGEWEEITPDEDCKTIGSD